MILGSPSLYELEKEQHSLYNQGVLHTHMHTHARVHTHMCTHARTHTHAHTHTQLELKVNFDVCRLLHLSMIYNISITPDNFLVPLSVFASHSSTHQDRSVVLLLDTQSRCIYSFVPGKCCSA